MSNTPLADKNIVNAASISDIDREKYFDDLHDLLQLREYELNVEKDNLEDLNKELELIEK